MKKALLVLFMMMLFAVSVGAASVGVYEKDENDGNFTYVINEKGEATITRYIRTLEEATLPNKVDGFYPVTALSSSFSGSFYVKTVNVSDSVKTIMSGAFSNAHVLTTINIGSGVDNIEPGAFGYSFKIENVFVDDSNEHYVDLDGILFTSDMTCLVYYPIGRTDTSYTVPDGVKRIESYAFRQARSLEEIILPDTLESVGEEAFDACIALKKVVLPDGVSSLERWAYANCFALQYVYLPKSFEKLGDGVFTNSTAIQTIEVSEENPIFFNKDGVVYSDGGDTLVLFPTGRGGSFTVPEGVKTIGDYAFKYCENLERVILPESLRYIGEAAFLGCSSIKSIRLPDKLEHIGDYAFCYCSQLTEIAIPFSVKVLGKNSFGSCESLNKATYYWNHGYYKAFDNNAQQIKKVVIFYKDVYHNDWYTDYVSFMYETDMMKGTSEYRFSPTHNITYAQAITLAARIHAKFNFPKKQFYQTGLWYQVYLDYCKTYRLIDEDDITNIDAAITREEFVELLDLMPKDQYDRLNPNITPPDTDSESVQKFYASGICVGSDGEHNFMPDSFITRAEVSAIVTRMLDSSLRVSVD